VPFLCSNPCEEGEPGERKLLDQRKWDAGARLWGDERCRGHDDGERAMSLVGARGTARTTLRNGHLHGVPCNGERSGASANLPDDVQSGHGSSNRMSHAFDVVVVGAGPGGIAAATISAEAGLRVCLLDDNRSPGGQIWRGLHAESAKKHPHGSAFVKWTERLRRTECEVWSGWQVIDCPAPGTLRMRRDGDVRDVEYRKLIVATGARERFLPFPGWTLPGVAGAGGLQALVKTGLAVRDKRIVVAGTGPLLLAIAAGLADAGANIVAIYEQAPMSQLLRFGPTMAGFPGKIVEGLGYWRKLRSVPYRTGCWVKQSEGSARLERVAITNGRSEWSHNCDWIACGFHLVPNLELPALLGCAIENGYVVVDHLQRSSVTGVSCVGELTGIGGLEKALLEGEIAGWAAAGCENKARAPSNRMRPMKSFARRLDRAFALRGELRALPDADTVVCRCEDVTLAAAKLCGSWREAKLHTRCGMGACQGRICGPGTEFLFGWNYSGARPPVFPATLASMAKTTEPAANIDCAERLSTANSEGD
jgi:D-hydroxyproline dehydrogenase subunit alpha